LEAEIDFLMHISGILNTEAESFKRGEPLFFTVLKVIYANV